MEIFLSSSRYRVVQRALVFLLFGEGVHLPWSRCHPLRSRNTKLKQASEGSGEARREGGFLRRKTTVVLTYSLKNACSSSAYFLTTSLNFLSVTKA